MTPRSLAVFLAILSATFVRVALELRGVFFAALWPALSAGALSIAYSLKRPGMLGKRVDGSHAAWAWTIHGPYFLFTKAVVSVARLSREPAMNEVSPGLFVGRYLRQSELDARFEWVVDLTAELVEPRDVRSRRGYRCVPTLDASAPPVRALEQLVEELVDEEGPILIHCAQGHGRSAAVAAALVIRRGLEPDVPSAERRLRASRPGIRMKPPQLHAIEAWLSRASFRDPRVMSATNRRPGSSAEGSEP